MTEHFGTVKPGTKLYIEFDSFGADGESLTLTGLATTIIEIYKDGNTTQRASDSGYALVDDGIDFDATTGVHTFTIDLADNTTAGFYSAGSRYRVVLKSLTINGQTVTPTIATFDIGYPAALVNTTIASVTSQQIFTLTEGPPDDDALNGLWLIVHDVASKVQWGCAFISDYTGSTKTITLTNANIPFTFVATDNVSIMFIAPLVSSIPGGSLTVTAGVASASIVQVDGSAPAAVNLKQSSLAIQVVTVQTAEGDANTNTIFDTDLPLENANYYGSGDGGMVIAFIAGAAQKFQTRRIVASVTGSSNTRITLEEALDGTPTDADVAVVLGRITELT